MAEVTSPSRGTTPSAIPLKRPLEDDHTPTVSSPLNPDAPSRSSRGPAREQREKKDSLKKREATGVGMKSTPEVSSPKRTKGKPDRPVALSPIRYHHPLPREPFHYYSKDPMFASREPEPFLTLSGAELKKPLDHTENKKNFRYTHCTAVPSFTHSYYYRNTDAKPYGARMSLSDSDRNFLFDEGTGCVVTNEKGWRMGRANVVAREGTFYYEVKILKGVCPSTGNPTTNGTAADALPRKSSHAGPVPHVRIGWARREAPLDAPVGFDGYSYGLTDTRLEPMHKSRASKFLDKGADAAQAPAPPKKSGKSKSAGAGTKAKQPPSTAFSADDSAREGDVIGLSITLPSLTLHRKIAAGTYNPLVDVGTGEDTTGNDDLDAAPNIVRDRFPVPYKGGMYFESIQYAASKGMEGYGDRGPFSKETPSPNHADATLRSLPGSLVRVWKNGRRVGTAFKEVMAFLPPCSHPANEKGVRPGLDDGMVGYYPAVGVFSGAVAQVNFGPEWWCSPEGFEGPTGAQGGAQVDEPKKENGEGGGMKDGEVGALRDSVKQEDGEGEVKKEGEDTVMTDANNVDISPNPPSAPKPANSCVRGIGERYKEQIAEDVVYDLIDEADWFVQDGGTVPVE